MEAEVEALILPKSRAAADPQNKPMMNVDSDDEADDHEDNDADEVSIQNAKE